MRSRPLSTTLAGAVVALSLLGGLTACSSASSTAGAQVSEADLSGTPVTAKDDMTALCEQIIAQALPLEAGVALAEASGYTTRVGTIDGVDQAVTADAREDRFTFATKADVIVGCTIG
jgi:hypothetical protein